MKFIPALILILIASLSSAKGKETALYSDQAGEITLNQEELFGSSLYVLGYRKETLSMTDFKHIDKILEMVPPSEKYLVLDLNTPGGSPGGSKALIQAFRERKCLHGLHCQVIALVRENNECSSACLYILGGSHIKVISPQAKFGFHAQRTAQGVDSDGNTIWVIDQGAAEKDLIEYGFKESWINELKSAGVFSTGRFTYRSGERLKTHEVLESLFLWESFSLTDQN